MLPADWGSVVVTWTSQVEPWTLMRARASEPLVKPWAAMQNLFAGGAAVLSDCWATGSSAAEAQGSIDSAATDLSVAVLLLDASTVVAVASLTWLSPIGGGLPLRT